MYFDKNTSDHEFKISVKVIIFNDFHTLKNPILAPTWKGLPKIIHTYDINPKIEIGNKVQVLSIKKLK